MPEAVLAVGLLEGAGAGAAAAGVGLEVAAATFSLTTLAANLAVSAGVSALAHLAATALSDTKGQNLSSAGASPVNNSRAIAVRQSLPPRRYVYGNCLVGGAVFFQDNNNPNLYIGICISDGVIGGVDGVYFGDISIPVDGSGLASAGSIYFGHFTLESALGLTTQTASALLTGGAFPSLDSNFRQQGVARAVVKLDWGTDAQNNSVLWGNSINPTFKVRGVKVYDPRDGTQDVGDETTWKYSDNPALCVAHALTHSWGVALSSSDVDWTLVGIAATDCEATYIYNAVTYQFFTCAGVFQSDADIAAQIADMLSSFGGSVAYTGGKFGVYVDKVRTSLWTITDDDILGLQGDYIHDGEMEKTFNAIKATYRDSSTSDQQVTSPVYQMSTPIAAEGLRETAVTLPFSPDKFSAQVLAYRSLQRTRDQRSLTLNLTDAALWLDPMDRVTISSTEASFLNGDFEVLQVDLAPVGCIVTLGAYNSSVYDAPSTYLAG